MTDPVDMDYDEIKQLNNVADLINVMFINFDKHCVSSGEVWEQNSEYCAAYYRLEELIKND